MIVKKITVSGKRKTAIAKATIEKGKGRVLVNKVDYEKLPFFRKLMIQEPLEIAKKILGNFDFNISVNTAGGGRESQIDAARLAIAKAIVKITGSEELKNVYNSYDRNLLVDDTRRKEAYKPGDSKARRKRQTSFR